MKTLFPMPRPILVLEIQDIATSDDPLEIFLQRKGWNLQRVKWLQESISEKLTLCFFDKRIHKLSNSELTLQRDIQEFIDR